MLRFRFPKNGTPCHLVVIPVVESVSALFRRLTSIDCRMCLLVFNVPTSSSSSRALKTECNTLWPRVQPERFGVFMKVVGALAAIVLAVMMVACGGSSSSTNTTDGAWSETLSNSTGQQLGSFTFTVTQNDATLTGSDLDFTNMEALAQCFRTGTVMNGLIQQGMMNGSTLTMTIWWTASNDTGANSMYMKGNIAIGMGSGSGTFTLTGQAPGCTSDQGTFTMTHMR